MLDLASALRKQAISEPLLQTLMAIAECSQRIDRSVQTGAVTGLLGSAGSGNIQGEEQKQLDVIANDLLKQALVSVSAVRGLASEEEDHAVAANRDGSLLVAFDPLDGSSNIDINGPVGTIFSVLPASGGELDDSAFLQSGRRQLAAGYVLYGPATQLVLTVGRGVQMFTLDPGSQRFLLTTEAASIAPQTREFAINMSNQRFWTPAMQRYIGDLLAGAEGPRGKNYNMRWIAAMVADVHRILCRGGLFSYPWDQRDPAKPGKLRLLYEANPMALLVEQAGGSACTDQGPILDLQPEALHQRVPVILGSADEVAACLGYHRQS